MKILYKYFTLDFLFDSVLSKKQVSIILSKLQKKPNPRADLEQYEIDGNLAAEILNLAYLNGDVEGKTILDLGCGSGKLAIASALFGAKKVFGVDIDKNCIEISKKNVKTAEKISGLKIGEIIDFFNTDVEDWVERVDTVIQNPPFGIQNRHADRIFLKKALECSKKVYSLHRHYSKSREFLKKYIEKNGGSVEDIFKFKFRLPHTFKFHKRPAVIFEVDLYLIKKNPVG